MDFIRKKLQDRIAAGGLRSLKFSNGKVDFSSNDYLGLSSNLALANAIEEKFHAVFSSPMNGSTGSRLLAGNHSFFEKVESDLANFFQVEAVLIFNSGYVANMAILSCIPQKGDTVILDEYIHASLKDGARLNFANKFSFRHNDLYDLEKKLSKAEGNKFVVVETLYSMDGDFSPIEDIKALADRYEAHLIVDEAHTTGLFGNCGNGYLNEKNLQASIPFKIYTFGKAMGIHGACIAGSKELIDYLINFARPFIYTTAMSPHSFVAVASAFEFLVQHKEMRGALFENIAYWNHKTSELKGFSTNESPIQTYTKAGNDTIKKLASAVQEKGYDVRPILSPTVKEGAERLRICLHAFNSKEQIDGLVHAINSFHE
jgi:8-amino-7-oxononanoate synthase